MTDKQLLTLFPTTESNWPNENVRTEGALLRDYFAAQYMKTISNCGYGSLDVIARDSYRMADAMLKARG